MLDTGGCGALSFNAPTVQRLRLTEGRRMGATKGRGVGGVVNRQRATPENALFGGHEHTNLSANFSTGDARGSWADPYVDGVMGVTSISSQPVLFDYPGRRVGFLKR